MARSADLPSAAVPETWTQFDEEGKRPIVDVAPVQESPIAGQSVLYVAEDGRLLSASILAAFPDGSVELQVRDPLNVHGAFRASPVEHDASKSTGTWHYAEE